MPHLATLGQAPQPRPPLVLWALEGHKESAGHPGYTDWALGRTRGYPPGCADHCRYWALSPTRFHCRGSGHHTDERQGCPAAGKKFGGFNRGLDDGKGCKVGRFKIDHVYAATWTEIRTMCRNAIFHRMTSFRVGPPELLGIGK